MLEKFAADSNDTEFEERLVQLTYPQVRSKLPRLVPMMVGFELLDVNEDETEASGIFAFRIGEQMVYVPIFFKDGHIKGLNLMYLENDDLFLPADDDWVDYLVNRQPFTLGKLVGREELQGDTQSTFEGVAEAFGKVAARTKHGCDGMSANILNGSRHLKSAARCDLLVLLPRFPKSATLQILNTMKESDEFGRDILSFYSFDKLAEIADKITKEPPIKGPSADPKKGEGIKYDRKPLALTSDDENGLGGIDLSDSERKDIQTEGVAIRDNRSETDVTKAYRTSAPAAWFAAGAGIFNILDIKGKQRKAVVFEDIVTVGDGDAKCKVIVTDDGDGGIASSNSLTATEELSNEEWDRRYKKLTKLKDATLADGDTFIIVNAAMQATPTLRMVGAKIRGKDGLTTLFVDQDTYVKTPRGNRGDGCYPQPYGYGERTQYGGGLTQESYIHMEHEEERSSQLRKYVQREMDKGERDQSEINEYDYRSGRRVTILDSADENDDFTVTGNALMVGADVRIMKFTDKVTELMAPCDISLWPQLKEAGARKLKIYTDGQEFEIKCSTMNSGMVTRPRALIHLVCNHGLNIKAAREILKNALQASATKDGVVVYGIKHAASFPELDIQSGSYGDEQGISESTSSATMDEGAGNPFLTQDIAAAGQAARTGQKSVFDAAVLTSLLRRHDVGTGIDEMLGDLTIGTERLGRILFLLYAHRDAFEEQYGQEDIPQLEDSLENLFKEQGETLLFLKKKSIETESGVTEPEGLLSPVA